MYKPSLEGRVVEVRPSQKKFTCFEYPLEIIRCATFSQAYLNRQVILLLNCLGVPDEVFLNLLHRAMLSLNKENVISNLKSKCQKAIKAKKKTEKDGLSKEVAQDLDLFFGPSKIFCSIFKYCLLRQSQAEIDNKVYYDKQGNKYPLFSIEREPIFTQIINNMVLGQAVNLKKKARIIVHKSCVLIGVIDETGTLEEGEVFLRINRSSFEKELADENKDSEKYEDTKKGVFKTIMKHQEYEEQIHGPIIITKNPCSHPGDIRILQGLREDDDRFSKLSHLMNVVVFPSKGYRPEQHKMSGGDLDGDVYMAIWEPEIVSQLKPGNIQPPAVYDKYPDDYVEKPDDDIADHMKRYFEKDNLGHLSNLHLALCDSIGTQGPHNPDAIHLSWLIGIAVDYAKHGKCVTKEKYEKIERKVTLWPDYMEKPTDTYNIIESTHILGKLYRQIDCKKFYYDCIKADHQYSLEFKYYINQAIIGRGLRYSSDEQEDDARQYEFHKHLCLAYTDFVLPFNKQL